MDASPLAAAARALTASPLAAAAALAACALLAALLARRLLSAAALSREYTAFRVVSRAVANRGERPVVFLTIRTSTAALPTGAHVKVRARVGGTLVVRSYTPTKFDAGECELMFRVYKGGPMSTHLAALRVGDAVERLGPTGLERYGPAPGAFSRGSRAWRGIEAAVLLGGGTGITPLLQVTNAVLQAAHDATRLRLVAFASDADDFMLEDRLRALAAGSRGQLSLTFASSRAPPRGAPADVVHAGVRALDARGLAALLGVPPGPRVMACVCGPDGFVERARELLAEAGYDNVLAW
jgi:cytochrome-b5 reductase